jgi:flagellar motor switch/type III secretory pathway protein FliN
MAAEPVEEVLRDAPVDVIVSFAPIRMTLAQVEQLVSGHVLELPDKLVDCRLTVSVGDQSVAAGHLVVMIEDDRAGILLVPSR